jgi:signal transduction histidine kinase
MGAQLVAAYRLGRGDPRAVVIAVGVPFLVLALAGPADARTRAVLLASLAPTVALAGLGRLARGEARKNNADQEAMAGTLLEHTLRGERARIARELHDVVAHHISMISVQAETARLATLGMPPLGAKRLLGIGDTARAALTEMRRLLGVLREDTDTAAAGRRDRQPQPGLNQLYELLDEAREATGAVTRLIVSGPASTLNPGIELAVYRIVQESLTNARRHAPAAAIDVELAYARDVLRLRVRDNGPGPAPGARGGGHGLIGMRERAAAVGGEVLSGAAAGGGFLVEARFPTKTEGYR